MDYFLAEIELKLDRNGKEQVRVKFVEGERVLVVSPL